MLIIFFFKFKLVFIYCCVWGGGVLYGLIWINLEDFDILIFLFSKGCRLVILVLLLYVMNIIFFLWVWIFKCDKCGSLCCSIIFVIFRLVVLIFFLLDVFLIRSMRGLLLEDGK